MSSSTSFNNNTDVFVQMQQDRTHHHPNLCQALSTTPGEGNPNNNNFVFVVMADTQFGMRNCNQSWDREIQYCQLAINAINEMQPRPLFCCICGDLVNMTGSIFEGQTKPKWALTKIEQQQKQTDITSDDNDDDDNNNNATTTNNGDIDDGNKTWTANECDEIQAKQYADLKQVLSKLHPDIALVCVCGNHDVGNRPTISSIRQYTSQFGNDYLSFWARQSYFIVINSSLFNDPTACMEYYQEHVKWLESKLQYATEQKAQHIFILSHHPLFIYNQDEVYDDLLGESPFDPGDGIIDTIRDGYFHLPKQYRMILLQLFEQYKVTATFSGHFHQNMISKTNFGMEMIITGPISSVLLQTTGDAMYHPEPKTFGYRIVHISQTKFSHEFVPLVTDTK